MCWRDIYKRYVDSDVGLLMLGWWIVPFRDDDWGAIFACRYRVGGAGV